MTHGHKDDLCSVAWCRREARIRTLETDNETLRIRVEYAEARAERAEARLAEAERLLRKMHEDEQGNLSMSQRHAIEDCKGDWKVLLELFSNPAGRDSGVQPREKAKAPDSPAGAAANLGGVRTWDNLDSGCESNDPAGRDSGDIAPGERWLRRAAEAEQARGIAHDTPANSGGVRHEHWPGQVRCEWCQIKVRR